MSDLQALATALRLRQNIRAILEARRETPTDLAFGLQMHRTWINKFLNGHREIQMKHIDRIAAYFGIEPYELLMPGISRVGERRRDMDRRSGSERRIGHPLRRMLDVKVELARARSPKAEGHEEDRRTPTLPDPLRASIVATVARLNDLLAAADLGRQTPRAREPKPKARPRGRTHRRSDAAETAG